MSTWPTTPDSRLLSRLCDVHNHPIDAPDLEDSKRRMAELCLGTACVMSSYVESMPRTAELAKAIPEKIIPAFGIHPWFCHAITLNNTVDKKLHYTSLFSTPTSSDDAKSPIDEPGELTPSLVEVLPIPIPLHDHLESLRTHLEIFPKALVGEVGIDRSFRIPRLDEGVSPGAQRRLTSLRTPVTHQLAVLEAQLDLAVSFGRNVSFHAVQAQGELVNVLKRLQERWGESFSGPPSKKSGKHGKAKVEISVAGASEGSRGIHIDIHSPLISTQTLTTLHSAYPNTLYFSFSTTICGRSPRLADLISATPDDKILIESDYNAPDGMESAMWDVLGRVCEAKGWNAEEAVGILEKNWQTFMWQM